MQHGGPWGDCTAASSVHAQHLWLQLQFRYSSPADIFWWLCCHRRYQQQATLQIESPSGPPAAQHLEDKLVVDFRKWKSPRIQVSMKGREVEMLISGVHNTWECSNLDWAWNTSTVYRRLATFPGYIVLQCYILHCSVLGQQTSAGFKTPQVAWLSATGLPGDCCLISDTGQNCWHLGRGLPPCTLNVDWSSFSGRILSPRSSSEHHCIHLPTPIRRTHFSWYCLIHFLHSILYFFTLQYHVYILSFY